MVVENVKYSLETMPITTRKESGHTFTEYLGKEYEVRRWGFGEKEEIIVHRSTWECTIAKKVIVQKQKSVFFGLLKYVVEEIEWHPVKVAVKQWVRSHPACGTTGMDPHMFSITDGGKLKPLHWFNYKHSWTPGELVVWGDKEVKVFTIGGVEEYAILSITRFLGEQGLRSMGEVCDDMIKLFC